jgi:hypothetical protein
MTGVCPLPGSAQRPSVFKERIDIRKERFLLGERSRNRNCRETRKGSIFLFSEL